MKKNNLPVRSSGPTQDSQKPHFSRQQISEDVERSMTGRPQKYGAAVDDDDQPAEGDNSQPGAAPATPEDQGIEPEQPGNEESGPGEPGEAASREEAESQIDQMPNTPEAHHSLAKKHHGNLHDLHKRLADLEAKSEGQGHEPSAGSGPQPGLADDDGY